MFINLSNHPSSKWSAEQVEAARVYGEIVDLPFPVVDPKGDEVHVSALADEYCRKVQAMAAGYPVAVHVMGEMTLTFAIVSRLQALGIPCYAATTERIITELPEGRKESVFRFVRFRKYQ